jgi:hypothetical protein
MNAAGQPHEPSDAPVKAGLPVRAWKLVGGAFIVLGTFAGGIANWHTVKSALFPTKPATVATIVSLVEPDISLEQFELQAQPPLQRGPSAALLTPGQHPGYRLVAYVMPAGTIVAANSEEPLKSTETKISNAQPEQKQEGKQIADEAKHVEEAAARERAKAAEEQKQAEAHVQEEDNKAHEAGKRAQEAGEKAGERAGERAANMLFAREEEAVARRKAQEARATVRAKRQDAARTPSERRVEAGKPARVEEVLHEAHLADNCRPSCGLKPIIEKTLKVSPNDTAAAAKVAQTVSRSPGVRVHYELTLKGLEHKVVALSYVLVQTNGPTPPVIFLKPVTIRTVAPVHEPEVIRGVCWVPLPASSRRYYLDLTVWDGEAELESKDTSYFF